MNILRIYTQLDAPIRPWFTIVLPIVTQVALYSSQHKNWSTPLRIAINRHNRIPYKWKVHYEKPLVCHTVCYLIGEYCVLSAGIRGTVLPHRASCHIALTLLWKACIKCERRRSVDLVRWSAFASSDIQHISHYLYSIVLYRVSLMSNGLAIMEKVGCPIFF